jgi:hypothetical protein
MEFHIKLPQRTHRNKMMVTKWVNKTIVEATQCMLQKQHALSTRFWVEVVNIATYLKA